MDKESQREESYNILHPLNNASHLDQSVIDPQQVAPLTSPIKHNPTIKQRLKFIDYFRGLTLAGMILVNNQGNWEYITKAFAESEWNGLLPGDCIFPSFLFINGVSISLSLQYDSGTRQQDFLRVLRRSIVLFFIGAFMHFQQASFNITNFRLMGVLQRQALCYFFVSSLHLTLKRYYHQLIVIILLLMVYCGFQYGYDVPGCGKDNLDGECNFGSYLDQKILGERLMRGFYPSDPEGFWSTLTSFGTAFVGYTFARIMRKNMNKDLIKLRNIWILLDIALFAAGFYLSIWVPINKKLWSISYMFVVGGISGFFFILFFMLIDMWKFEWLEKGIVPLLWLGMNPLALYILSEEQAIILDVTIKVNKNDSLQWWIEQNLFESWMNPYVACIAYAFFILLILTLVAWVLYRQQIFIKL